MNALEPEREFGHEAALGTSRASEALGLLLCDKIEIKALNLYYLHSPERLQTRLRLPRRVILISQSISGREEGKISLAIAREGAPALAAGLAGRHTSLNRKLSELDLDAIKEAANIVAGSYLSLLARPLGLVGVPSVPVIVEGAADELALSMVPRAQALCIEARLFAAERRFELTVLMAAARQHSKVHVGVAELSDPRPAARL
jgi:chemotaxis protein CheY-P-specific phosphatase CheC